MSSNKSTRWHSRANFRLILLQSAITSPHLESRCPKTSDQGLSDDVLLIRLTSSITSQNRCNLLRYTVWYENYRKNMENLLVHKLKNVDFRLKTSRSCHYEFPFFCLNITVKEQIVMYDNLRTFWGFEDFRLIIAWKVKNGS